MKTELKISGECVENRLSGRNISEYKKGLTYKKERIDKNLTNAEGFEHKKILYDNLSDEELIKMIHLNDSEAENVLLSKYKKIVRRRASSYYMAGADREDIIQEGMIGVFKAIRGFDSSKGISFSTFANLCMQRQMISAIKGASRLKHLPLNNSLSLNGPVSNDDEADETLGEIIADEKNADPESLIVMQESLKYVQDNLHGILTEMERCIWIMYIQGKTYKEIAEKLHKTHKAVHNAIRRSKKKLAELLNDR